VSQNVHREPVWSYVANLAYGVTAARDPQTGTTDVLSYEDQVVAGRIMGPRVYSTGPGVFSSENIRDLDHALRNTRGSEDMVQSRTMIGRRVNKGEVMLMSTLKCSIKKGNESRS
jgi:hypothetical protein